MNEDTERRLPLCGEPEPKCARIGFRFVNEG